MPELSSYNPYLSLARANNPIYVAGKLAGNVNSLPKMGEVAPEGPFSSFQNVLNDAIMNIEQLQEVKDADSYNLSIGNMDDLSAMMINSQRADTALSMVVELRNRLLEGYNEIMRTSI